MSIEFKEGAVCYADGKQLIYNEWEFDNKTLLNHIVSLADFQINEPKSGYYIPKSELDTEDKYNQAIEVLGLFGREFGEGALNHYPDLDKYGNLTICHDGIYCTELTPKWCKVKLTFEQLMEIGELKRKMNKQGSVSKVNRDIERAVKSTINIELDKPKTASQYLNECIKVQTQRGEQYDSTGTGERSFDAAAKAYNALTGGNLKGSDICLLLTCVKVVRQYSNPKRLHEDSLLDMVSYSALWAEELNKELK